jgi:hypothetical protein
LGLPLLGQLNAHALIRGDLLAVSGTDLDRVGATHVGRVLVALSRQKVLAVCAGSKPR